MDRARFPRDKPCAGWVTPQAMAAAELDLDEYGVLAVPFLSHMVLDPTFLHRRQAPLTDPAPYFAAPALGLA